MYISPHLCEQEQDDASALWCKIWEDEGRWEQRAGLSPDASWSLECGWGWQPWEKWIWASMVSSDMLMRVGLRVWRAGEACRVLAGEQVGRQDTGAWVLEGKESSTAQWE
jgi:hypothetical protein